MHHAVVGIHPTDDCRPFFTNFCFHLFSLLLRTTAAIIRKIEAVVGRNGRLACNLTSDIRGDRVALVIWYKEGRTTPIYSYDARDAHTGETGSHHGSDGKFLFNTSSLSPAILTIFNLTNADEGAYRCRVDFLRSPTKNTKVQLTVITPPENLSILNELGKHIHHYILGPYNEGSSVNLSCVSSGGRPFPKLTWVLLLFVLQFPSNLLQFNYNPEGWRA